jgi:hypothetical protein
LVLAGPAGDWRVDPNGRIVSADTGEAVVRLDDLLTLWRRGNDAADSLEQPAAAATRPAKSMA